MSFFDQQLPRGPTNLNLRNDDPTQTTPVGDYIPMCQWASLVGVHYLEAQQIIQREAPWAYIYTVANQRSTVRSNHRSEWSPGPRGKTEVPVSFRGCTSADQPPKQCCKTSPLKTPECFKADLCGLPEVPKLNRICIYYDSENGLVNQIPVRG